MTAQNYREYCYKTENVKKIQELYPLVLADPRTAQKKRAKNGKKFKKAENSPAHPLAQAKKNF